MGKPFAHQGYMTGAVRLMLEVAFRHLALHRVEAACLPHNQASIALLTRCGFAQEGLARGYLKIAGAWRDHLLFARLAE
jgi:ribosomal-protein-alanine N-acetyltransferase